MNYELWIMKRRWNRTWHLEFGIWVKHFFAVLCATRGTSAVRESEPSEGDRFLQHDYLIALLLYLSSHSSSHSSLISLHNTILIEFWPDHQLFTSNDLYRQRTLTFWHLLLCYLRRGKPHRQTRAECTSPQRILYSSKLKDSFQKQPDQPNMMPQTNKE